MTIDELIELLRQQSEIHGRGDKPAVVVADNRDFKPMAVTGSHSGDEVWIYCRPRKGASASER